MYPLKFVLSHLYDSNTIDDKEREKNTSKTTYIQKQQPLSNNSRINKSPFVNDINSKFTLKLFIKHAFYTTISLYFIKCYNIHVVRCISNKTRTNQLQLLPLRSSPLLLKISFNGGNVYLSYALLRVHCTYIYRYRILHECIVINKYTTHETIHTTTCSLVQLENAPFQYIADMFILLNTSFQMSFCLE